MLSRSHFLAAVFVLLSQPIDAQTLGRFCETSIAVDHPHYLEAVSEILTDTTSEFYEMRSSINANWVSPTDSIYLMTDAAECAPWLGIVVARLENYFHREPGSMTDLTAYDIALYRIGSYIAATASRNVDVPPSPDKSPTPIFYFDRSSMEYHGFVLW